MTEPRPMQTLPGQTHLTQNFKRCRCHPAADRHRFGNSKMLNCVRKGCNRNWFQHQQHPQPCKGGQVPAAVLGRRFDA